MLSKRGSSNDTAATSGAKQLNIADLFLSNEVSGARAAALFEDAGAAGAAHVQDLRNWGGAPETPTPQTARATQEAQPLAEGVLCWPSACGRGARKRSRRNQCRFC